MKKILFAFLFVLSIMPAAFSAPIRFENVSDGIVWCDDAPTCANPQTPLREFKSIKGTIYSKIDNSGREHFTQHVKVQYKSNNGKHHATYIVQPSFGFVIPAGPDGEGTVTFTALKNTGGEDDSYDPITMSTAEWSGIGKDIIMKKKSTSDPAPQSADSTPKFIPIQLNGITVIDSNQHPISGVTVTDQTHSANNATTNNRGGFSMTCWLRPLDKKCYLKLSKDGYEQKDITFSEAEINNETKTKIMFTKYKPANTGSDKEIPAKDAGSFITIRGTVVDEKGEPLPGVSIMPWRDDNGKPVSAAPNVPKDQKIEISGANTALTNKNGEFVVNAFPRGVGLLAQAALFASVHYNYDDVKESMTIQMKLDAESITRDEQGNVNVTFKETDKNTVTAVDPCNTEERRKQLHAKETSWFKLEGTHLPQDDTITVEYADEKEHKQANQQKCIPTRCIDGYTLEKRNTADAKCLKCETSRVPFAKKVKIQNNQCIEDGCISGFRKDGNGGCALNCNDDSILKKLGAKSARIKTGVTIQPNNDYSGYCYPTECNEPKYKMIGTGENATCQSQIGKNCTDYIEHATAAKIDDKGVCVLSTCDGVFKAEKYGTIQKKACTAAGHAGDQCDGYCDDPVGKKCDVSQSELERLTGDNQAKAGKITKYADGKIQSCETTDCKDPKNWRVENGKCVQVAGTPCDKEDLDKIPHAISGTKEQLKNDKIVVCKPTCWENYTAKLKNGQYECVFDKGDCPSRLYASYNGAKRLIITADKQDYWDDATGKIMKCDIKECSDKTQTPSENAQSCVAKCSDSDKQKLESDGHALETTTNNRGECIIKSCQCGYTLGKDNKCIAWGNNPPQCTKRTNPALPENAKTAYMACDTSASKENQTYCQISECTNALYEKANDGNRENAKCEPINSECPVKDGGKYASTSGKWELDKNGDKICVPNDCGAATGYVVDKTTRKCVEKDDSCPKESQYYPKDDHARDVIISQRNAQTGAPEACKIKTCRNGMEPSADGQSCVTAKCGCGYKWDANTTTCVAKYAADDARKCYTKLPEHAKVGKMQCQTSTKNLSDTCELGDKCSEICVVQECEGNYVADQTNNKCNIPTESCEFSGEHAEKTGKWVEHRGVLTCQPRCIGTNYEPVWDNQNKKYTGCEIKRDREGKPCNGDTLRKVTGQDNAEKGKVLTQNPDGSIATCEITECKKGYNLQINTTNPAQNACISCPCGQEWDATSKSCKSWADLGKNKCDTSALPNGATAGDRKCIDKASRTEKTNCTNDTCIEVCWPTVCDTDAGFALNQETHECVSQLGEKCTKEQLDTKNAVEGTQRKRDGQVECVISKCKYGYERSSDRLSCTPKKVLSPDDQKARQEELEKNAQAMLDKKNSLANRMIGGAGIAATGVGGAMIGAALSEQAADAAADRAMNAYLQSAYCDYGNGTTVKNGEVNVELPGGNDLVPLYTEYAQLANDLKIRKEALGLRPGIESEVVINNAETNLYDNAATGITGGAYASIARAIMNPEGEDAKQLAAQKQTTKNTLIGGATAAGVGAVGSAVANIIVNKDNQNQSKEIMSRYESKKIDFDPNAQSKE